MGGSGGEDITFHGSDFNPAAGLTGGCGGLCGSQTDAVASQLAGMAPSINGAAALFGGLNFAPVIGMLGASGGAAITTLDVTAPLAGRTLLPAVAGAVPKLVSLGNKFGISGVALANTAIRFGLRLVDNAEENFGNINVILPRIDGESGFIRVTLDPTESRIISAGLQSANQVLNGWLNGRFTTYR